MLLECETRNGKGYCVFPIIQFWYNVLWDYQLIALKPKSPLT